MVALPRRHCVFVRRHNSNCIYVNNLIVNVLRWVQVRPEAPESRTFSTAMRSTPYGVWIIYLAWQFPSWEVQQGVAKTYYVDFRSSVVRERLGPEAPA